MAISRIGASLEMTQSEGPSKAKEIRDTQRGRVHRGPKNSRRPLAIALACAGIAGIAILAVAAWLNLKASTLGHELSAASKLATQLKQEIITNDTAASSATVEKLTKHTANAREQAEDPAWISAGAIPWIGANFRAAGAVATAADDVATHAAAPLVGVAQTLDWKKLGPSEDGVDLRPLVAAKPKLLLASHAVRQSSGRLNSITADGLLPQVSGPLARVTQELESLRDSLDLAANVTSIAPTMMGADSERRYLLFVQNNAELRATGGIPGALAVLVADNGRLRLESQTSAGALGPVVPSLTVDVEQEGIYSQRLGRFMQDTNLTPHFPTTASTAIRIWEEKTGEKLSGVISIDPVALGYVLSATGPVQLSDPDVASLVSGTLPTKLSSANAVKTLLSDVYSQIPNPSVQDEYFAGVSKEIFSALAKGKSDAIKLLESLGRGVNEGRILLWSSHEDEQSILTKYPLSGSVLGPTISPAQFGVYFNDGTGAKMDYYVKRTVQLVRECPSKGYEQIRVKITSKNTAPANAAVSLPSYVTGGGAFDVPAGTVQTNIVAYGPVQSNVETALADGNKIGFASQLHGERPVGTVTVVLPPGKSSTVEFSFGKIVQHTEPKLSVTPTVQALNDVILNTIPATCDPAD